jgi:hypothetical protein
MLDLWQTADDFHLRRPEKRWTMDYGPELRVGVEVEYEHTEREAIAAVIAAHHLDENESYYEILKGVGL